ncbi:MAG TPA: nucleotide exchange factor GrpE [Bacillota bacterium]|nr:nucleotide exchange factor GrpE [Bacillota bacterium]
MEEREAAPPEGDAVEGRTEDDVETILGETGALPEESAEESTEALRQEMDGLRAELEAARRQAGEHLQARIRLQADFDNYRKRMMTEQARWRDDAVADAIRQELPAFDNLERAAGAAGDLEAVRKGVDLTLRQLREVLRGLGLEEIAVGDHTPFDPNLHEAISPVESAAHAEGEVVKLERRGYTFKGALLRAALVTVAKAAAGRNHNT